jgi:magnesium transporter
VLKTARYLDEAEKVEFSEIHVLVGKDFIVTVRYEEIPALEEVRRRLEGEPESLRQGPQPILREIMDQIVDDYEPVLEGLGTDIQEVEDEVFGGNADDVSQRIYELSRELVQFQRATSPLAAILIVPTLITGIYGMNFDFMPELHWTFGYPFALALMVSISVGLYAVFRHVRWL